MRFKLSPVLALTLCTLAPLSAAAQDGQGGQKVVDDFVVTRGVIFEQPRQRPAQSQSQPQSQPSRPAQQASQAPKRPAQKGSAGGAAKKGGAQESASKKHPPGKGQQGGAALSGQAAVVAASAGGPVRRPIGLGFTLFVKQGESLIAADPSRVFRQGDLLRIALETNTDGHLYIFHTENGRNPQMLFPNPGVDDGRNFVAAHSRDFYPTDLSAWFEFDEVPAVERLYFVVARAPLPGVPTGRDLVKACGGADADCLWKPTPAQWERIRVAAQDGRVVEGINSQLAELKLPPPANMTRGIKVKKEEPAPALVRVNSSDEADLFVTTIDLIHK